VLRRPYFLHRIALVLLVGGVAVVVTALVAPGLIEDKEPEAVRALPEPGTTSEVAEARATPTAVPSVEPTAVPVNDSPITRLVIPSINVDAPVVVLGLTADRAMESPSTPTDVGWYELNPRANEGGYPGEKGGNAVFSGHVDYRNYGPAVFANLDKLSEGDEIFVRLEDGTEYKYTVTGTGVYDPLTAPIKEIVGRVENQELLTLITCDGTFNSATRQYDRRLVVRAERVEDGQARSE
jgi:LPXTG-site transpeptidase (sortase) family protein